MKIAKKALILFLLLSSIVLQSVFNFAHAQAAPEECSSYAIVFGNGIMNDAQDMSGGLDQLKELFGDRYNDRKISYDLARNPSDGFFSDLVRVLLQKIVEDKTITWEIALRVWLGAGSGLIPVNVMTSLKTTFSAYRSQAYPQQVADLRRQYEEQYDYVDSRVMEQTRLISTLIKEDKKKVLLISHSQGNLYANAVYRRIDQDPEIKTKSLALVGVASPANFVAGGGTYVTSGNDLVIAGLRTLISANTLPSNIAIPYSTEDLLGHAFIGIYTSHASPGRAQLKNLGLAQMDSLEDPDLDDPDTNYRWYYAIEPHTRRLPDEPADMTWRTRLVPEPGCFIHYTNPFDSDEECIENYHLRRSHYQQSWLMPSPRVYCGHPCEKTYAKTYIYYTGKEILYPGEEPTNQWYFTFDYDGSGKDALKSLLFPRIFDPANPGYIGFDKSEAQVRYRSVKHDWTYIVWYPLAEPGPVEWYYQEEHLALAGIKQCKAE
ncbi:MAG: hypothetical protein ACO1N5_00170 [Noviherbaspirillum sp.]